MINAQPMTLDAFEDRISQLLDMLIDIRSKLVSTTDPQIARHLLEQAEKTKEDIEYLKSLYKDLVIIQEESQEIRQIYSLIWQVLEKLANRIPLQLRELHPIWESLPPVLKQRLDNIEITLDEILLKQDAVQTDIRRGFSLVYYQLDVIEQQAIEDVLQAVRMNQFSIFEIEETMSLIHVILDKLYEHSLIHDQDIKQAIQDIKTSVSSELGMTQKLEVSLPILPFAAFKLEFDASQSVDLKDIWLQARKRWLALIGQTKQSS